MKVKTRNILDKRKRGRRKGFESPFKKSIEDHIKDGTYRKYKHGPKPLPKLIPKPSFKLPSSKIDNITKRWIKNSNDELAVKQGCRFDERYPDYFANCFHTYLRHSKGSWCGKPFDLLDWQANDIVWPMFGWIRPDGFRRFRRCYVEIPKKNGKSTLASALGVAFLIFDCEPGAEVYSCAADKEQSSIVHGEAINMLEASEDLMRLVKINRTNKNILYKAQRSLYRALSSTIAGKEGYNIHCAICDELHVWNGREVWDSLMYGFAAREQPMLFVITTAGEDMQSVCREQHDYTYGVLNDMIEDTTHLGIIYAAEEDKWRDESEWKKANPSLGETIRLEEMQSAYKQLQVRPSEEPNFKRRRLNIWCTSTKVWLDPDDWNKNERDIAEFDCLGGKWCTGGCDLAKTKDTSSIVFAFPDYDGQGNYFLKPFVFMPEDRYAEIKHLITGLPQWVKAKDLILTDGNVADYEYMKNVVCEWIEENNINVYNIAFDPYNAEQFTRELAERLRCERFAFGQTITNYAEPTEEFERLLIMEKMHHGSNNFVAWQFSNCMVTTDAGGRTKPVRQKKGDIRTIDSCVSCIMAYCKCLEIADQFYDGAGVWQ